MISLFFWKKQSKLFSCHPSTSFYFQFWTGSSVRFIHHYWFWCSLNIFRLESINRENIQVCFKDYLNVNMRLFSGSFAPITQAPRSPASSQLSLCEKQYAQTKPRICHWFNPRYFTTFLSLMDIVFNRDYPILW